MKRLLLLAFSLLMLPTATFAQWENAGPFPPQDPFTASMHGVAVDAEGKVWLSTWSASENLVRANGDTIRTAAIYVFNPDGTEASFSPIQTLTVDGVTDTLNSATIRGLGTNADGNILVAARGADLHIVNHQTGQAIRRIRSPLGGPLAAPRADTLGNIFLGPVLPGNPLRIYDQNLQLIENAVDTTRGFSRSFAVTANGRAIYWAGYNLGAILKYSRPDEFSPFIATPDTLLRGVVSESIARNPATGHIWVSNGPASGGVPSGRFEAGATQPAWYAIDPETDTIVDSLMWNTEAGFAAEKPRGIAFSPDGDVAYAVMFDATSGAPSVQKFIRGTGNVAIERNQDLPAAFTLEQNYPNPFNPSTRIEFALLQSGQTSLKVYDVLGREVATLVNEVLPVGTYTATFDGSRLSSGTYLYVLESGDQRLSKTMVLLK